MAGRKAAASSEPRAAAVTVDDFPMRDEPYLDPELAKLRDKEATSTDGVAEISRDEPSIDPALEEQRKKDIEAEKNRKSF